MTLRSFRIKLVLVAVFVLFVFSFQQPAICFRQMTSGPGNVLVPAGHVVKTGKQMALGGLLGPIFGNFAVFANPLLIVGCVLILLKRMREAMFYLGLAVLFALQTFQLMVLPYHEDEGGVMLSYLVRPLAGWYYWFGAIFLTFTLAAEQHWLARHPIPE